jgi:hypothetical protein
VDSRRLCAHLEAFRAKRDAVTATLEAAEPPRNSGRLLQLRVLRLGFFQEGSVGVGVFPGQGSPDTKHGPSDVALKGARDFLSKAHELNCLVVNRNQLLRELHVEGVDFLGAGVADKERSAIRGEAAP